MNKGEKVRNFRLSDEEGKVFDLFENLNMNILLVFYPKDNSYICSKQLTDYSGNIDAFERYSIKIVGINDGSSGEHSLFCTEKNLNITLLSDPDLEVAKQFSALYPFNILKRKLVLISTSAEIIFEKNLPPFSYWDHEEIIGFISKNEYF
jgi:peroxiredoxin